MKDKFFVDTNIIVYAHDAESATKQSRAQEIIIEGIRLENAVISTQVLCEFFVTITEKIKKPLSVAKARREIILLSHLEIIEVDVSMIIRAIEIRQRWKISYWDGLIISAAERSGCSTLWSEDLSDRQSYGDVKVRNPFVHSA